MNDEDIIGLSFQNLDQLPQMLALIRVDCQPLYLIQIILAFL
jgi:hypothetical protein